MRLVINLDDFRPATAPEPLAETASGKGKVIQVAFRELDRLERNLDGLNDLPSTEGYEVGDVTVHTNALVVTLIQLVERNDEVRWARLARFDERTFVDWLLGHRSRRNRLEREIRRQRCDHDFNKRSCRKCGEPKPVKYRVCRRRPRSWTATRSNFDRPPICRRRQGHAGACSWEGDPGSFTQ